MISNLRVLANVMWIQLSGWQKSDSYACVQNHEMQELGYIPEQINNAKVGFRTPCIFLPLIYLTISVRQAVIAARRSVMLAYGRPL